MNNILLLIISILKVIYLVNSLEDVVTMTENSITPGETCFDSSCIYEKTDMTTVTPETEQTEKLSTKSLTSTTEINKVTDITKKTTLSENITNDKEQKTILSKPTQKPKPKPTEEKPKTKEEKPKTKLEVPKTKSEKPVDQNKTDNAAKHETSFTSKSKPFQHVKSCNCDTSSGICEINCCCDDDCTKENKKAFTYCEDESNYISRSDYCFSPNVIYKNNTPYKAFNLRPGLLCIAKDNLPDKVKYYTHQVIESETRLSQILQQRKNYKWKTTMKGLYSELDLNGPYNFGSPVWILKNFSNQLSLDKLSILHEGVTSLCHGRYHIGYLEQAESSCLIKGTTDEATCMETFLLGAKPLMDAYVLKSPHLLNSSFDLEDLPLDEVFTKVKTFICNEKECFNSSSIDFKNNKICTYYVNKVSCIIKHNGTEGIADMICFIHLELMKLNNRMYRQNFEIKFEWINSSNMSFERSGKPGYLTGKPLIIGNRTEMKVDDKDDTFFVVSNNKENWITTMRSDKNGLCGSKRSNILFNENIKAECTLKIKNTDFNSNENCSSLFDKVMKVLFGKPESFENMWISSWGDPKFDEKSSWVPLIKINDYQIPQCDHLVTSAHYHFIYSLSGPLGSPHAKLIGAIVETKSSPFSCDSTECSVTLVTTVSFAPISTTPKLLYPKHPALRIHLPKDFFYPFSSSSSKACYLNCNYYRITILLLITTIIKKYLNH